MTCLRSVSGFLPPRRSSTRVPPTCLQRGSCSSDGSRDRVGSLRAFGFALPRVAPVGIFPRISSPFSFFAFLGSPLFSTNQAKSILFAGVLIPAKSIGFHLSQHALRHGFCPSNVVQQGAAFAVTFWGMTLQVFWVSW